MPFDAAVNYAVGTSPRSVAAGDFDNDTNLDLAVANGALDNVSIRLGNGDAPSRPRLPMPWEMCPPR